MGPMRAMILSKTAAIETHPLTMSDVPTPAPGCDELLVKVSACGVCRSNLHMIEGDWLADGVPSKTPIIPGHEVTGRVAQLGEGVEGFAIGDRVGIQPLWSTCLKCEFCLSARENLCPHKQITGETLDGGYAEYMIANAFHTYHIPEALNDAEAAPLFCPGITAYRSVSKARLGPGKSVAVFGMGGVGHMVVQFAKLTGADVITVARGKRHRELALELGSARALDASENEEPGAILKREGGVDAAIVFAPSGTAFEQAIAAVKNGGILVNGAAKAPVSIPFDEEKQIVGSVIGTRHDMRAVLDIAAAGKVKVIAEKFPLEGATTALKRLKRGDIEARAVLVM